ncbi:MAG: hypothetical protein JNM36_09685 [Chitinophagales bacterium]|nr:hypothetical protein [Chitinophagales bacterium]
MLYSINYGLKNHGLDKTVEPLCPINIMPSSLPNGIQGGSYAQTLSVSGGVSPYTWSISSGTLPAGVTLNLLTSTTASLSGTTYFAGTSIFDITVADAAGCQTVIPYTIVVMASNCFTPPAVPVLWVVDEDATRIHLWSFEDYNNPTSSATDYGRMKYQVPGFAGTYEFYNISSPDMESFAVNPQTGKAYFTLAGRIKISQGAPADGASGTIALFSYNLNQAKANIGNIVLTLEGHIKTTNSATVVPEALTYDPSTNRLYLADPVGTGENLDTQTDILNYVNLGALNPNPLLATTATILGPITGMGEDNKYVDGMELDEFGNLYTIDGTDEEVYTVSKTTGAIIAIYDGNIMGGLPGTTDIETIVWDPINNKLLGVDNEGHNIIDITSGLGANTIVSTFIPGTLGLPIDADFEGSAMWASCLPIGCSLVTINAIPTACNPATNAYSLDVTVSYSNQPSGDIIINVGGTNYTFTPDGTSPDTYTITGLTSNGTQDIDVSATFVGDATCTHNLVDAYDAPASCNCNGTIGNYVWNDINKDGLQNDGASNGLNSITVELYKDDGAGNFLLQSSTTTANDGSGNPGYYSFQNLTAGNYKLKFPLTAPTLGPAFVTIVNDTPLTDGNSDGYLGVNETWTPIITLANCEVNNTLDVGYTVCDFSASLGQTGGNISVTSPTPLCYTAGQPITIHATLNTPPSVSPINMVWIIKQFVGYSGGGVVEAMYTVPYAGDLNYVIANPPVGRHFHVQLCSGTPGCMMTVLESNFAEIVECCTLTVDSAVPTACNPATNTYDLAVSVSYSNPPTGNMTINVGGTNYTFTPDGTSPDTYTVTGLTSNGTTGIDVSATFVGDATCTHNLVDAYNAPVSCNVVCPTVSNPGTCANNTLVNSTLENGNFTPTGTFVGSPYMLIDNNGSSISDWWVNKAKWVNVQNAGGGPDGSCSIVWVDPSYGTSVCLYPIPTVSLNTDQCYTMSVWAASFDPNNPTAAQTMSFDIVTNAGNEQYIVIDNNGGGTVNSFVDGPYGVTQVVTTLQANSNPLDMNGNPFTDANSQTLDWSTLNWQLVTITFHTTQNITITPNYSINGNTSNGVAFDNPVFGSCCTQPCTLTVDSAVPTACNPADNTYSLAVTVTYANPPSGDITINVGGTDYTFTPDGTSPDTYTVTGLTSNGATAIDVSATFVGDAACTHTLVDAYDAPASCMSSCVCFQHYKATSTSQNTSVYSTWQDAIHEVPDYILDFESYALGVDISNTPLGSSGFSVTWANLNGGAITTTDDVASSPSIGNVTPMVSATLNTNEGDDSRLTFEVPVDYVGFYILDLDDDSKISDVTVVFSDGSSCTFGIDHTLDNCACQEFLGIVAPPNLQISSVTIFPNTGSRYGLDGISYGYNSTCPVQITSANVSACSGTDVTVDVTVDWSSNAPTSGTITVASGSLSQNIDLSTATSPTTLQFTLPGDGSTNNVLSANLNGSCACVDTVQYNLPTCSLPCSVTVDSAVPTACNPADNTYSLAVAVTYANPPSGDITINVGGTDYTFTPDGTSPDTYTVTGLTSNGTTGIDVSATFVGDAACTHTLVDAYNAPASCIPCSLTLSNVQVGSCNCTSTSGYLDVSGLSNLLSDGVTFGTSGTYNDVPLPGQGTVDISYSYTGSGNTLTPDFRELDVAQGNTISTDYTSLGFTGTSVPGLRNKIAATQTGTLTYNFDQPVSNINLLMFDVDWDDTITITAIDANGNTITDFSGWTFDTGDLTSPIDAAPATWNAATGVIYSTVNANGERNFAMLTPDVPLSQVQFSFTGTTDPNNNSPHTQYSIYSNLTGESCTATLTADVAWTNAPSGEDIIVTAGAYSQTVNVSGGASSPQTISMLVPTDGSTNLPITAIFETTTACTDSDTYSLPNCPIITCNLTATATGTPVSCNGGNDGTASATPSGNLSSVTYLWSNGETTSSISGLTAGTYTVTVTESATCTAVAIYDVTQPPLMDITCTKTDVTTNGGSDGTASVNATGGTSPYTYLWSSGETTSSISGKTSGTYTVTVTDDNGCTAMCNSTINEPGALCNLTAAGLGNVMCNNNGTTADASDDYISFTLNPTGTTLGSNYVVTVSSGSVTPTSASYGQATTFQLQNGSAGSGNTVTITITDLTDTNCKIQVDIPDTGSCSTPSCPPAKCIPITVTKQ